MYGGSVSPRGAIFNTPVQQHASLSYLSFCSYPPFVWPAWPISGLCYLTHAEDDLHIVIWGAKAAVEEHIQTHIHNSASVPLCLLSSHCRCDFLITIAHAQDPGMPVCHGYGEATMKVQLGGNRGWSYLNAVVC